MRSLELLSMPAKSKLAVVGGALATICALMLIMALVIRRGDQSQDRAGNSGTGRHLPVSQDRDLAIETMEVKTVRGSVDPTARAVSGLRVVSGRAGSEVFQLCQACSPGEPHIRCGVDCRQHGCCPGWHAERPIPWQALTQGEYIGPPRTQHVPMYQVRVGDQIEFIYRRKREQISSEYKLNVGDQIRVESLTDDKIDRELDIQIDGTITLPPSFQVPAAGRTIAELTADIEKRYQQWYKVPAITVTPINTERRLQDLLESVDSRFGSGGLSQEAVVSPEGTVQLPGVNNVWVQGLTIDEVGREMEARYAEIVQGIGVTPKLIGLAPHFIYVGGEVALPNRYDINTPTTVVMAILRAGGFNYGANLREIVIFRRTDDWHLAATKVNLRKTLLLGKDPCPDGEIWLRDSDIVYVPKGRVLLSTDFVDLIFTRGLYRIIPFDTSVSANTSL